MAAEQFDVFVTVDRKLPNQHDVTRYDFAIVVLVAPSNRLAELQPLVPRLLATLNGVQPGQSVEVS